MRTAIFHSPGHPPGHTLRNTPGAALGRRLALVLSILVVLGGAAHAGSRISVVVTGESWMQPALTAQIEGWLSQHGHSLVQLPPDAVEALKQCFAARDLSCARDVVEKLPSSTSVLYADVDARNAASNAPDVTLTAYWFDKGREAVAQKQPCPRCTDLSLRTTADDVLKKLIGGADLGHVKLKSAPPGATIKIDGKPIGVAPLDWDLTPGKHTIEMIKPGLQPATRDITVTSNKSDLIVMTLTTDGNDDRDTSSTLPGWMPWSVTVVGGVALVTGVGLIVFSPEPTGENPNYYPTTRPGIGFTIGGAVVGVVGGYWLWSRSRTTSAPVAAYTGDTAYIGWLGRF